MNNEKIDRLEARMREMDKKIDKGFYEITTLLQPPQRANPLLWAALFLLVVAFSIVAISYDYVI